MVLKNVQIKVAVST